MKKIARKLIHTPMIKSIDSRGQAATGALKNKVEGKALMPEVWHNTLIYSRNTQRAVAFLCLFIMLIACVSIPGASSEQGIGRHEGMLISGVSISEQRTIILDNTPFSEKDVGGFTSWHCYDYVHKKNVLLEFGYFNDPNTAGMGFILYDGGDTGELTYYRREGIDHRWDWGLNTNYSFVIKPDGTGLYYDFTNVKKGEGIKARDVYKCYKK